MSKSKASIVFILLFFLVIMPLCASEAFSIGVGASLSYSQDTTVNENLKFNTDNIAIGLEGRFNIYHLQFDAVGEISVLDSDTLRLAGIPSMGASFELYDVVKVGLTLGPRIAYIYSNRAKNADELEISNGKNLIEAFKDGPVNVRLMLDVFAGPVISIGFAYTIPTEFSINNGNWEALLPSSEGFKNGQFSLSIQMKLF
jgi:hypothetical protein